VRQLVLVAAAVAGLVPAVPLAARLQPSDPAPPEHERILFVQGTSEAHIRAMSPGGGHGEPVTKPARGIESPDWSPDGTRIAFVTSRDIYVANADGSGLRSFAAGRGAENQPAWSPDGEAIAYTAGNSLYVRAVEGEATRRLVRDGMEISSPTWSPDGSRIAYSVVHADQTAHLWVVASRGGRAQQLTSGAVRDLDPAWSPGGRFIAFVRSDAASPISQLWLTGDGGPRPLLPDTEPAAAPAWSPTGARIAFARGVDEATELYTVGLDGTRLRRITENQVADQQPDWASVPASRQRLPDLDQQAPSGLTVTSSRGHFKLGFTSSTDNIGIGPIWIRGVRDGRGRTMEATQLVTFGDGIRSLPRVGRMRFTISGSHRHWHLLRFQSYELRRAGSFDLVVRDRKSGFCLLDRWGRTRKRVPRTPRARFLSDCGQGNPGARRIEHGTSVGFTDRYPAHFHGQNVDLTGVRAGRYWLVHRANPFGRLRELDYENNDAAALIRITWPDGRRSPPNVDVLRACQDAERC
jgi:dipeptidyl aminopeptidase/acylaminoacyl peptidase